MMALWEYVLNWLRSLFFQQEMELSLIGLQNAGKTSLVNVIATGGFNEDMIPTVGFNMRKVTKGNVSIKLWDLGGQPRFRSMWERYCRGVSAIVYVVDASDHDNIPVSRRELHELLSKPSLAGIPLLLLGNKCDKAEAVSRDALIEAIYNFKVCFAAFDHFLSLTEHGPVPTGISFVVHPPTMASLSFAASVATCPAAVASPSTAPASSRRLNVESAHHVNKKATGRHVATRPKKHAVWDRKRGGTKDYGPLPEAPPVWRLEEDEKAPAASS
ncbi:unnamed protein product [Closterium sp. NIES-64]|nr:unnamed protein product [Closterium sp. NIES-64]